MTPNQNANLRVVLDDPARAAEAEATQSQYAGGQLTVHRAPLAIEVKQCVLKYPIGADNRGSLKSLMLSMFGTKRPQISAEYVDALRGVNFTVQRGERVALLGHNGSGKSTLLRAIAGIYPLASGSVRVSGRIGTLFEIGLGFEPEATGRENIYYRGMAMGCSRKMLAVHEEEIVHFCGLGDFIDLPVRTYSAGMFVRLAFAISTQFSPEVLLIDEIFGAGDAVFRERAQGRMMKIVNEAGILVMASHDLTIVKTVCNRTIWMEAGRIIADGPTDSILPDYTKSLAGG